MTHITKINVIWLWKAWLPLASHIAKKWIEVIWIDIDKSRCELINNWWNPIPEEVWLAELLQKFWWKELFATSDWEQTKNWNVFIVIVPLFIDKNNNPDYAIVDIVTHSIAKVLKKWDSIIFETTFPPTTTENRLKNILEKESSLKEWIDFYLWYSPERIMTGVSLSRFEEFPKVIWWVSKVSSDIVFDIYSKFIPNLWKVKDTKTAEFIKVIEWCYRDSNIALANELYKISETLNIDFYEARRFANHQFCNIHTPSTWVWGHCIPVYPNFLIKKMDELWKESFRNFLQTSRDTNEDMINYWAEKIILKALEIDKPLKDIVILIKWITYREWVKELYHSRNFALAKLLKEKWLNVKVFDEMYSEKEIQDLWFKYGKSGDIEFDCFSLELK